MESSIQALCMEEPKPPIEIQLNDGEATITKCLDFILPAGFYVPNVMCLHIFFKKKSIFKK